jgi:hypothetical protein
VEFHLISIDQRRCKFRHPLDLQVAVLEQHLSFCSSSIAPISRVMLASLGKMPTTSTAA